MSEPEPTQQTDVQIPLFEPIVEEVVKDTQIQPALGSEPPGNLSVACECGHRGNVKPEYAGRTVECPNCHRKNPVPG